MLMCCQDNGVKVVEPLGEMLVQEWEDHATHLANARSSNVIAVSVTWKPKCAREPTAYIAATILQITCALALCVATTVLRVWCR